MSTPARNQTLLGIGLLLGSVFVFTTNDVLSKWLTMSFAIGQLLLFRSLGAFVALGPALYRGAVAGRFRRIERPWLHVLRMLCATGEVAGFYVALTTMPLADVILFWMSAPIFVALMANFVLRESVSAARWGAILLGFAGVVIALFEEFHATAIGASAALAGAVLYAVMTTLTRVLRGSADSVLIALPMAGTLGIGVLLAPIGWATPSPLTGALLMLTGAISVGGHVLMVRALRLAPASVVMPFKYVQLVLAAFYGWLIFGDVPRPAMVAGGAVIIGAGLWLWWLERRGQRG